MIEFIKRYRNLLFAITAVVLMGIIIAVGCNSGGGNEVVIPEEDEEVNNENSTPNRITSGVRENTTALGLSSFALGVRGKFPLEDNQNVEGIGFKVAARAVRKVATNELYTFPEQPDPQQVKEFVKYLIDNNHQVVHEIHILCGPCMRDGSDAFVLPFMPHTQGNSNQDEEFIRQLSFNELLQEAVLNLFSEVVQHAKDLENLGAEVYICPELEDNHQEGENNSFGILLEYLRLAGWQNSDQSLRRDKVVRNGGSVGKIPGIRYERHGDDLANLRPGDFFNMDGISFSFDSDGNNSDFLLTENEVRALLEEAHSRNIIFYVWHSELQGLAQINRFWYSPIGSLRDRTYILKKPKEQIAILQGVSPDQVVISSAQ